MKSKFSNSACDEVCDCCLLSLEFFGNSVQLLTVGISSDGATIWKNFPVNNPSYSHQTLSIIFFV
jgi:hypothetical protein